MLLYLVKLLRYIWSNKFISESVYDLNSRRFYLAFTDLNRVSICVSIYSLGSIYLAVCECDLLCSVSVDDVLHTLTGAMSLLRRCRVNAALTIQLFSQLFHFINMWLFNRLVTAPDSGLCSHYWGAIVRQQLGHIEAWAEKQGLELAADCHLSRIVQVSVFFYWYFLLNSIFGEHVYIPGEEHVGKCSL